MVKKYLTDSKQSIYLFVLVFVVYALVYMTKNCFSAAMAAIVNEGIFTKSQTGLFTALFYLFYAPLQIVGGIAADKYSPAKLILIGTLGAGIANLLIYYINGYIGMLIIWTVNAVVQFGVWPAIFKIVTTQIAREHRIKAVFYINLSSIAGLFVSYLCVAFIHNWKFNFMISAVVLFVTALGFWLCYGKIEREMVNEEMGDEEIADNHSEEYKAGFFKLMLKAGIPALMLVSMIINMLYLGVKALAPVLLMESYESLTPQLSNALNIILIIGSPIGIFIAKNRFLQKFNVVGIIALFLALSLPFLLLLTFVGKLNLILVVMALLMLMIAVGAGTAFLLRISLGFEKYGRTGTLSGLFNCMAALGTVLANYVFAKIAEIAGWEITTKCWFWITVFAFFLAVLTVPVWKNFETKIK